ncbi:MAG: hypothetical protein LBT46_10700 [Planctomycetaceae bacterium]|jgi:hypothetical protein|nr:hypothetical protein [Planctomycetaceae bacterium]
MSKIVITESDLAEQVQCAYCGAEIGFDEPVTACNECSVPYHADCWNANGHCAIYGCSGGGAGLATGTGYIPQTAGSVRNTVGKVIKTIWDIVVTIVVVIWYIFLFCIVASAVYNAIFNG